MPGREYTKRVFIYTLTNILSGKTFDASSKVGQTIFFLSPPPLL